MFAEQNIDLISQAVENEHKKMCSTYGDEYHSEQIGRASCRERV